MSLRGCGDWGSFLMTGEKKMPQPSSEMAKMIPVNQGQVSLTLVPGKIMEQVLL